MSLLDRLFRSRINLMQAASAGDVREVNALIKKGVDLNASQYPGFKAGWTALMQASVKGHSAVVRALLSAGADPNLAIEENGGTALLGAIQPGHIEVVESLLAHGADATAAFLDSVNGRVEGRTAMTLAEQFDQEQILWLLGRAARDAFCKTSTADYAETLQKAAKSAITSMRAASQEYSWGDHRTVLRWGRVVIDPLSNFSEFLNKQKDPKARWEDYWIDLRKDEADPIDGYLNIDQYRTNSGTDVVQVVLHGPQHLEQIGRAAARSFAEALWHDGVPCVVIRQFD